LVYFRQFYGSLIIGPLDIVSTPVHGASASSVRSNIVIGRRICALISRVRILPRFLLLLLFLSPFLFGLFGKSQSYRLCHFSQMLGSIIEASEEAGIPEAALDAFVVFVDEVEAADLFLLASKPA
jgi:hypothetical protein